MLDGKNNFKFPISLSLNLGLGERRRKQEEVSVHVKYTNVTRKTRNRQLIIILVLGLITIPITWIVLFTRPILFEQRISINPDSTDTLFISKYTKGRNEGSYKLEFKKIELAEFNEMTVCKFKWESSDSLVLYCNERPKNINYTQSDLRLKIEMIDEKNIRQILRDSSIFDINDLKQHER